jgi:aspartate kinase
LERHEQDERNRGHGSFAALAHAHVNVKMIDQGSSELNIIIGVENRDFETAIRRSMTIFWFHEL